MIRCKDCNAALTYVQVETELAVYEVNQDTGVIDLDAKDYFPDGAVDGWLYCENCGTAFVARKRRGSDDIAGVGDKIGFGDALGVQATWEHVELVCEEKK